MFTPVTVESTTAVTLYVLSVLLPPEWHPADRAAYFETHFHRGLARCVHFLAISEFGRQEMIRNLGIAPERITRTYMGIRPGLGPLPAAQTARELRGLCRPPPYRCCM